MWAPLRRAMLWIGVALLGVPLLVPEFLWAEGSRSPFRYSFEYGLAVLALAFGARTPFRDGLRRVVVAIYVVLLVFLVYEDAFKAFFRRDAALVEDWRFAINLLHFVSAMTSWRWLGIGVGGLLAAIAFVVGMDRVFAAFQTRVERTSSRKLAAATAAWAIVGGASVAVGGPIRSATARVAENYRASVAVRRRLSGLGGAPRDARYDDLMRVRLAKRPNFYLLVIEAYGEVLVTWDMEDAYRALMERVRTRLEAAGYRMRSAYSTAPVHSGRSWLSLATMQTGIMIDQPESFAALQAASTKIPTLVGFLRSQGYHTASLEPLTRPRTGVDSDDPYGHELRVDGSRLGYEGRPWGFGQIPDQYSLNTYRRRYEGTLGEPRYLFYMAVTTHYPWSADTVPPFEGGPDWPPLAGKSAIGSEFRRHYLESVEYEWRALTEFLEADRSPEIVVVVVGDHQPRLESNAPGEVTFRTPVHVIARDGAFVDRFGEAGFQPGLFAEPGRAPPLRHEGFFSLFVTKLALSYGTLETVGFARYYPEGISLEGLNP
jgi:hypothetical protein